MNLTCRAFAAVALALVMVFGGFIPSMIFGTPAAGVLPAAATGLEPPNAGQQACASIWGAITWVEDGVTKTLYNHPNDQTGVPVNTLLTVTLHPASQYAGKEVKFGSPNQYLQLIEPPLGPNSVSDSGTHKYNVPSLRQNVNFETRWPTGDVTHDGAVSFRAIIHADNLQYNPERGGLLTINGKVLGGKCSAKWEIYGVPPKSPPPGPCPGITVLVYYGPTANGPWKPVVPVFQNPNYQYEAWGPYLRYVILPSSGPMTFDKALALKVTFNHQLVLTAAGEPLLVPTVFQAGIYKSLTFDWGGEQIELTTVAIKANLDTVGFRSSYGVNGPANNLCSTQKEIRLKQALPNYRPAT